MVYTSLVRALPPALTRSFERQGLDLTLLVVRLGAMGDILRTIPPVRLLRSALPHARIVWVLDEQWRQLLEDHEDLDDIMPLPRKEWDDLLRSPLRWLHLLAAIREFRGRLRERRADLAIDFHGNLRSGLACQFSGAPVRVGYAGHQQKEGNRLFTTHRVAAGSCRTPRMERNLALVRALGVEEQALPGAQLPMADVGTAAAPTAPFAIIAPGASRAQAYKKPPAKLLGAACRLLHQRGICSVVVYGPGEEEDARAVVREAGDSAQLAPPTTLPALAALLERAKLFIGGDSGPLHMACATGCPVLGIYGPTDPIVNQPWGVLFRTVFPPGRIYTGIKRLDREAGGFAGLTVEQVCGAAVELLEEIERLRRR
jgi:heptosyltransferase-1